MYSVWLRYEADEKLRNDRDVPLFSVSDQQVLNGLQTAPAQPRLSPERVKC